MRTHLDASTGPLADLSPEGVRWSFAARSVMGAERAEHAPETVLPTASIGKLFLLIEVARRIESGALDPLDELDRRDAEPVADSGLWQHLRTDTLPVADLCALIGSVSDNLATNALIAHLGLAPISELTATLGISSTALLDVVRDQRGPEHPPALSVGCAGELCDLAARLARGEIAGTAVSRSVIAWLRLGTDLSMVASAAGLDPLVHTGRDRGISLWNKTGTQSGVRADVGVLDGPGGAVAYALLAAWDDEARPQARDHVLATMRDVGAHLVDAVRPTDNPPSTFGA